MEQNRGISIIEKRRLRPLRKIFGGGRTISFSQQR
jgi:hypothetical protein